MTTPPPIDLAAAREQFLALVDEIRPDLHRYASRLVGSAIDGEDVVQDTLAKAFYALSQAPELPPLRPWLFRIAHNAAIDQLRRYDRTHGEPLPEHDLMPNDDLPRDPEVMRAALAAFMTLPVSQRSAVILKDVLGDSLEDIAAHLDITVEAVKALLVRGRQAIKQRAAVEPSPEARPERATAAQRLLMQRYVELFNQRDWPGVQALLVEECRLDLVSKSQRRGKSVGGYFGRYAQDTDYELRLGTCEGRDAIGVFRGSPPALAYVVLLELDASERVSLIRDFRYVPYLAAELSFVPA